MSCRYMQAIHMTVRHAQKKCTRRHETHVNACHVTASITTHHVGTFSTACPCKLLTSNSIHNVRTHVSTLSKKGQEKEELQKSDMRQPESAL